MSQMKIDELSLGVIVPNGSLTRKPSLRQTRVLLHPKTLDDTLDANDSVTYEYPSRGTGNGSRIVPGQLLDS